ncbi:carbonic anhydrase family protein [Variovorax dokdonensis]|uniref:carbonic anhydrase n=1 Tax=Variovorax dokdonensis TaxID=344883 RepID=A0ABT7NDE6_9BURK|nr:carbonic anhydrase family protein [Variovorax dokdonensis]MDM0045954.1 carbonic anhydrase family protein [Variovorax dokdonensis]
MKRLSSACCAVAILLCGPSVRAEDNKPIDYSRQHQWVGELDRAQSPIDIVTKQAQPAGPNEPHGLDFRNTRRVLGRLQDQGHSVRFDTGADTIEAHFRGRYFRLVQLHFHLFSEHAIDGVHQPMEAHLVFKAQNGALAVVGVLFSQGDSNPAVQSILDGLPESGKTGKEQELDVRELLPENLAYFHYLGSLTTPPLTQNVEWYVLKQPVSASAAQLAVFRERYADNNRKLQPRNGRPLIESGD